MFQLTINGKLLCESNDGALLAAKAADLMGQRTLSIMQQRALVRGDLTSPSGVLLLESSSEEFNQPELLRDAA